MKGSENRTSRKSTLRLPLSLEAGSYEKGLCRIPILSFQFLTISFLQVRDMGLITLYHHRDSSTYLTINKILALPY